ncbi:hypothetical protein G7067_09660 [Leucobacter insecticola]|uniref:Uncharacterized protein n=1 Tax=Leucobacter insecticola TaxID=2714934 RepID=A0A6G8FKL1_9MICO|nr:hypothetical protein [Leucobacter insecticola]QIM16612.1 hypothetical protein G7067_09660 [Leucobacter insecticola]
MTSPTVADFPTSYADARSRILLRPFGVMPGAVRHLELSVAGRVEAFPVLSAVSDEINLAPVVSLADGDAWLTAATLAEWGVVVEQVVIDSLSDLGELAVDIRQVGTSTFVLHSDVWRVPCGVPLSW